MKLLEILNSRGKKAQTKIPRVMEFGQSNKYKNLTSLTYDQKFNDTSIESKSKGNVYFFNSKYILLWIFFVCAYFMP